MFHDEQLIILTYQLYLYFKEHLCQLFLQEGQASSIGTKYKLAQNECIDAEERADAAVKALWVRTHGAGDLEQRFLASSEDERVTETEQ